MLVGSSGISLYLETMIFVENVGRILERFITGRRIQFGRRDLFMPVMKVISASALRAKWNYQT